MFDRRALAEFTRTIEVASRDLTERQATEALHDAARRERARVLAEQSSRSGGIAPTAEVIVDGHRRARIEEAEADSTIVIEYEYLREVVVETLRALATRSPQRSGRYLRSFMMLVDGQRTGDISAQSGDHGVPINPAAARKMEVVRGPATLLYGANAIGGLAELVRTGAMSIIVALFIIALVVLVTFAVVFVERGQRKILVNYAKRQVGNKVYGGQSSHLPLKLNMSGVIPPIFASSIILLPATIVGWFATGEGLRWLKDLSQALSPGQPIYVLLYAGMIVFFCFFYTALVFNSRETADNLKKSGAFIPGIRPGEQTAKHIDRILSRLTLAGAIYITAVCLLPEFLVLKYNVPFYFGGTSLLIIVVVTMDFWAQVQSYVMSQQYESLLKKASFKTS